MAQVAVFDPTQGNRLISVGDDPGSVPTPLIKTPTAFTDGTAAGSAVDFGKYTWNTATQQFNRTPPPPPTSGQTTADGLLAKAVVTWTPADQATALQLMLKAFRGQF